MKRDALNVVAAVFAVVLLAAGVPWIVGQVRSLPAAHALAKRGNQRIVTLEVGGMTCKACAKAVQNEIAGTPGVSACEVRVKQQRAYVVCDPSVPDTALVGAVHRAGPGFLAGVVDK